MPKSWLFPKLSAYKTTARWLSHYLHFSHAHTLTHVHNQSTPTHTHTHTLVLFTHAHFHLRAHIQHAHTLFLLFHAHTHVYTHVLSLSLSLSCSLNIRLTAELMIKKAKFVPKHALTFKYRPIRGLCVCVCVCASYVCIWIYVFICSPTHFFGIDSTYPYAHVFTHRYGCCGWWQLDQDSWGSDGRYCGWAGHNHTCIFNKHTHTHSFSFWLSLCLIGALTYKQNTHIQVVYLHCAGGHGRTVCIITSITIGIVSIVIIVIIIQTSIKL